MGKTSKYLALACILILMLILAFNLFNKPSNDTAYQEHLDKTLEAYQQHLDETSEAYKKQLENDEKCTAERIDKIYSKSEEQLERFDKILDRWEKQADKMDHIISKIEYKK